MKAPRPTINVKVPTIGDGNFENNVYQKLAPIFQNIATEIHKLNVRLTQLEQIGPGVHITYTPPSLAEFKAAIEIVASPVIAFASEEEGPQGDEVEKKDTEEHNDCACEDT